MGPAVRGIGKRTLVLVVLLAITRAALYAATVPPWQAPDEPRHVEYAALLADGVPLDTAFGERGSPAEPAITLSMARFKWLELLGEPRRQSLPSLREGAYSTPPAVGRQPPLYYQLAALAIRQVASASAEARLYTMRVLSLTLLLLTALAAVVVARGVLGAEPVTGLLFLSLAALLPMPAFIGGSANNDTLSMAAAAWFCCAFLLFVKQPRLRWALLAAALGGLTIYAKPTASAVVIAALVVVLWLAWCRLTRRLAAPIRLGFPVLAALALLGALGWLSTETFKPAGWYNTQGAWPYVSTGDDNPQRSSIVAEDVFADRQTTIVQALPLGTVQRLAGKVVTLGGWARCAGSGGEAALSVSDRNNTARAAFAATREREFHAVRLALGNAATEVKVGLEAVVSGPQDGGKCFFDGIVLAAGSYPLDVAPEADDNAAGVGWWGEQPFRNLVYNGSGNIRRRSLTLEALSRLAPLNYALPNLDFLLDPYHWQPEQEPGYWMMFWAMFTSYVGRFGWMNVPLPDWYYQAALVGTLLAVLGGIIALCRTVVARTAKVPGPGHEAIIAFAVLSTILAITGSYLRFLPPSVASVPQGRYLLPVLLPIALLSALGWRVLLPAGQEGKILVVVVAALIFLDSASIILHILPRFYI